MISTRKALSELLNSQNKTAKTPAIQEDEEMTPKEEFQFIINEMNRDLKKNESAKKRKKKVIKQLIDFMNDIFPPQNFIDDIFI